MNEENNMQSEQPAAHDNKPLVWLLAVIIIVGLVWVVASQFDFFGAGPVEYAEEGEVVADFPAELLPDSVASVESSYAAHGEGDVTYDQATAVFKTTEPREVLIDEYNTKLVANGWNVTGLHPDLTDEVFSLTGTRDADTMTAVFQEQRPGVTQVTITYLTNVKDRCADGGCADDDFVIPENVEPTPEPHEQPGYELLEIPAEEIEQ